MSTADLPTPRPVPDSSKNRRYLLFLLWRSGWSMGQPLKVTRACWRELGRHAHGLLVTACNGTARTPSWFGTSVGRCHTSLTVSQTSCPLTRSDPTGSQRSPSPPTRSQET